MTRSVLAATPIPDEADCQHERVYWDQDGTLVCSKCSVPEAWWTVVVPPPDLLREGGDSHA